MILAPFLTSKALSDIEEISIWYNSQKKGLGKEFTKEIRLTVEFLTKRHLVYQKRSNSIRCAQLKKFPFMIHYLPEIHNKRLVILAVLHTSRDPRKWPNKFEE